MCSEMVTEAVFECRVCADNLVNVNIRREHQKSRSWGSSVLRNLHESDVFQPMLAVEDAERNVAD